MTDPSPEMVQAALKFYDKRPIHFPLTPEEVARFAEMVGEEIKSMTVLAWDSEIEGYRICFPSDVRVAAAIMRRIEGK